MYGKEARERFHRVLQLIGAFGGHFQPGADQLGDAPVRGSDANHACAGGCLANQNARIGFFFGARLVPVFGLLAVDERFSQSRGHGYANSVFRMPDRELRLRCDELDRR